MTKNKKKVLEGRISFRPTKNINKVIKELMNTGKWTTKSGLIVHALSIGLSKLLMEEGEE